MTEPTQLDWAQLAAYIDGEGAILLNRFHVKHANHKSMWLRVIVSNTDPRLPAWCAKTFGIGKAVIADRKSTKVATGKYKPCFRWQVSCKQAEVILRGCMDYFIIKREEAEIALAFQGTLGGPGIKVSRETRELREQLRQQLHSRKRVTPLFDPKPEEYKAPRKTGPKPKLREAEDSSLLQ